MDRNIEFEIGQTYSNRKGAYEVLQITGNDMLIRWDTGEEVITTVTMQNRIVGNMNRELKYPGKASLKSPREKKSNSYRRRWDYLT